MSKKTFTITQEDKDILNLSTPDLQKKYKLQPEHIKHKKEALGKRIKRAGISLVEAMALPVTAAPPKKSATKKAAAKKTATKAATKKAAPKKAAASLTTADPYAPFEVLDAPPLPGRWGDHQILEKRLIATEPTWTEGRAIAVQKRQAHSAVKILKKHFPNNRWATSIIKDNPKDVFIYRYPLSKK